MRTGRRGAHIWVASARRSGRLRGKGSWSDPNERPGGGSRIPEARGRTESGRRELDPENSWTQRTAAPTAQHGFGRDDVDGMLTSPGAMGRRREDWRYGPRPLELPRDHPLPPPLPPPDFSRPPPPWLRRAPARMLRPRPRPGDGAASRGRRDLVRWPPRRAGPGREKPRDGDPEPRRYLPWRRDGDGRRDGDEGCDDGWDEEEWRGGGAVARDDRLAHADDDGDVWLPGEDEIIVPEEHEGFQMSEEWLALFAATERRREKVRERRREARRRERPKVPAAEVAEAKVAAIIAARRAAEANDGDGGADASVDERGERASRVG